MQLNTMPVEGATILQKRFLLFKGIMQAHAVYSAVSEAHTYVQYISILWKYHAVNNIKNKISSQFLVFFFFFFWFWQ